MEKKENRIVILGAGESGFGSAYLAKQKGFEVFVSDSSKIKNEYKQKFIDNSIEFEENGHTPSKILNATEIIKSPGIPDKAEIIKSARSEGIPIISEIEFAGRYTNAKMICITGSNGKTTTTTLIYDILKNGGLNVGLGGNIGNSFAYQVATEEYDWYVLELSSFQLDGMYEFKADIAILTNVTPDHLDRYDYKLENYVNSKFRIIQNQTSECYFICSLDDTITESKMAGVKGGILSKVLYFSVKEAVLEGAYITHEGIINVSCCDRELDIDSKQLQIKGIHNIYNSQMAAIAAIAAGVNSATIEQTIINFKGVEHRLELVGEFNDVLYINDSKATNVDSAWYALQSIQRPTIWIAGGTDKGNDYTTLHEIAKSKVTTLICMGVDNVTLEAAFRGVIPFIYSTSSMKEAIDRAKIIAKRGDCVLLSPACASFDLFENYEDRGRQFKDRVLETI